MASHRSANPRLNYYGQSPVRGQLENPDGTSKSGWRYIQCTDTPNELRVLLPPRTALIYSHLLKAEMAELAKDKTANWERILQIRHLKDRMIRKCTRLGRSAQPKDQPPARVMFQTLHAPPDFRLKEMERWFKLQGGEVSKLPTEQRVAPSPAPAPAPYCRECSECMAHQARTQAYAQQASVRRTPSTSKIAPARKSPERVSMRRPAPAPAPPASYPHMIPPPGRQDRPVRTPSQSRGHVRQASAPAAGYYAAAAASSRPPEGRRSAEHLRADHAPRPHVRSPDPLPIPYRARPTTPSEKALSEHEQAPLEDVSPEPRVIAIEGRLSQSPTPGSSPTVTPPKVSSPPNGLPTIHEHEDPEHEHRPIVRRRSSLKKRDSMSRLSVASQSKSVAWAMDRDWVDQMSQYIKTSDEAESLSHELDQLRADYEEEIDAMRHLCISVEEAQERVKLETENLRQNQQMVKIQENRILARGEQLAKKQAEFQAKVLSVLEESKRVVQLCDKKRDIHDSS